MIYFDHNATTPIDERVQEAMMPYLTTFYGNPSSLYRAGRVARSALETAREQVAGLVGAQSSQVVFTSGGTEANNLAIKGLAGTLPPGSAVFGATEHPSVREPIGLLGDAWKVEPVDVDHQGYIMENTLPGICSADIRFASIMLANNETGVIQDISGIARILKQHNVTIHCDAIQAAGKIPIDFNTLGAQILTLSGHKIYGPKGTGALIVDKSLEIQPLLNGGGQEKGIRAGTENVAGIVGFGKAAELALDDLEQRATHSIGLRDKMEEGLAGLDGVTIFAKQAGRLPNTLQFSVDGADGEMLLMEFDREGIAVSSGSACSSGDNKPSHVLAAMGVDETSIRSAVRISFGIANTQQDVDRFLEILRAQLSKFGKIRHAMNS